MKLTEDKKALVAELVAKFGNVVTRNQLCDHLRSKGVDFRGSRPPKGSPFPSWITNTKSLRAPGRGQYDLSSLVNGNDSEVNTDNEAVQTPAVA
jgi:hypothetical protein